MGVWGGAGKGEPTAEEVGWMCERVRGSRRYKEETPRAEKRGGGGESVEWWPRVGIGIRRSGKVGRMDR